ncbi:hypothetical protein ACWEJZ_31655 [Streptomyces bacillaris]
MTDQSEAQTWSTRARPGAVELPPGPPAGTVRTVTGTRARQVNDQEAHDFGISTERACREIGGQPHAARHVPTPEELASRE